MRSKNPFASILATYFDWLREHFGHLADEATRYHVTAGDVARDYLGNPVRRQLFQEMLPGLCQRVEDFWRDNGVLVNAEVRRLPGLKARFGGDVGPQVSDAVFERAGLYFESILVQDALLNVARLPEEIAKIRDYYFLKYAITHVMLRDVYLTDIYPPIAVLTDHAESDTQYIKGFHAAARLDCVLLTNELYEQNFDTFGEVEAFVASFANVQEALNEVQKPELIYFEESAPLDPLGQWDAYAMRSQFDLNSQQRLEPRFDQPKTLLFAMLSRTLQARATMFGASFYEAHPLVVAPVSFHWLHWIINTNNKLASLAPEVVGNSKLSLTNALLSKDLNWLSDVPLAGLVELRRTGRLSELRSVIGQELDRVRNSSEGSLEAVIGQVDYNLSTALQKHQDEIKELDKAFRSELTITGSTLLLSVAAALQPVLAPLAPPLAAALTGAVGTTSLAAMVAATTKHLRGKRLLSKSAIGILWQAKKSFEEK